MSLISWKEINLKSWISIQKKGNWWFIPDCEAAYCILPYLIDLLHEMDEEVDEFVLEHQLSVRGSDEERDIVASTTNN